MTDSHHGAPLRAFLIHGLAGGRPFYFSGGLDVLARKLNAHGVTASVHAQGSFLRPYGEVGAIASEAIAAARKGARPVLIGHSMGADAALKVAVQLAAARVAVPLVVCFDPTSFRLLFGAPPVPANVARALCFYQKVEPSGARHAQGGAGLHRVHSFRNRSRPSIAPSMTIRLCTHACSPK